MSQENVEVVRSAYRAFDERGVDGFLDFVHEDIEYFPMEEDGVIRGRVGIRQYFERWGDAWEDWRIRPTAFSESGDRVCATVAMNGRGRGSGLEVAMEFWQVWQVREGRFARVEEYTDEAAALKAVGLSE